MAAKLFLSTKISTAFSHLVSQIYENKSSDVLTPVTILLPTTGIIHDLRGKLGDTMGVQMNHFYRLGNSVLDEAGIPIHEINDMATRRLIKHILGDLHEEGNILLRYWML